MATRRRLAPEPPAADEFELSLFGPGVGECALVHLGKGEWLIADSCIDSRTQEQPALSYLKSIGFDPATDIRIVCATHFHSDHIRGMAQIVQQAVAADFYCSAAASVDEFWTLIGQEAVSSGHSSMSAMREFRQIIEVLEGRAPGGRPSVPPIRRAHEGCILFHRSAPIEARVVALAPSDQTVTMAQASLAGLMNYEGTPLRAVSARKLNDLSVALWVEVAGTRALLGGDLEVTGHPATGWNGVLLAARRLGIGKDGDVFKVAHHGSANGDEPQVWTSLLGAEVVACLAPYRPDGLPRADDVSRICGAAASASATAASSPGNPDGLSKTERSVMSRVTLRLEELSGMSGQIRIRRKEGAQATIELKAPALDLCRV